MSVALVLPVANATENDACDQATGNVATGIGFLAVEDSNTMPVRERSPHPTNDVAVGRFLRRALRL